MTVPLPFLVALAATATCGLLYGVVVKAGGRAVSTRLLLFEVAAVAFFLFGWIFLAAWAASPLTMPPSAEAS